MTIPDPKGEGRFHYAGVGGSGMSALAQFQALLGGHASGSDRSFDQGGREEARAQLTRLGVQLFPQDGSGVRAPGCSALVVSTAVEDSVPDVRAARELGLPILHRSELLAHFVASHRTLAVSGTSGKSTVVAMTFELLRGAGRDPSVITGGDLELLRAEGLWGNAWRGGELLAIEADESDGSLVRYEPAVAVVLNLQRDHKPESEVSSMFETFVARAREAVVLGEGDNLAPVVAAARAQRLPVVTFGFSPGAHVHPEEGSVELGPRASSFDVRGTRFTLPVPGRHNVENALAALATAQRRVAPSGGRVLAVYQPHGYAPTRFLRADFVDTFAHVLGATDRVWWLEVFYAGGTTTKDFSSADIVTDLAARGLGDRAAFAESRDALVNAVAMEARPGDLVLVMGARDPSLTGLARRIVDAIAADMAERTPRP